MDVLASVTPAIPVRDFGSGSGLAILGIVLVAAILLVVAALIAFARATNPHHHSR